jgi:hypothetical protein
VYYWGEDKIAIGCESRSIEAWLTDSTDVAEAHGYTADEREEYREYVELIRSKHINRGVDGEPDIVSGELGGDDVEG